MTIKNIELQHKITELSTIDEQTGAYDFRRFIEQVQTEYQRYRRYGEPFTIISILYEMAHPQSGDDEEVLQEQLLKATTDSLRKTSRATDTVYRYGQHEFAVLLPDTDKNGAKALVTRLKGSLTQITKKSSAELHLKIGIGSVSCPEDTEHEMELIDHASKLARTELAMPLSVKMEPEPTPQLLEEQWDDYLNNHDHRET
jgi:diguanylate cyclase (GGDEF)-like protein